MKQGARTVDAARFRSAVRDALAAGRDAGTAIKLGLQTGSSRQVFDRRILFKGAMRDAKAAGVGTTDAIRTAVGRLRVHSGDTAVAGLGTGKPNVIQKTSSGMLKHQQASTDAFNEGQHKRGAGGEFTSGGATKKPDVVGYLKPGADLHKQAEKAKQQAAVPQSKPKSGVREFWNRSR